MSGLSQLPLRHEMPRHRLEGRQRGRVEARAGRHGYLNPRYTIRDASRHLSTLLADGSGLIATSHAETLFTENSLRYRSVGWEWWLSSDPEVLIVAGNVDEMTVRNRAYRLIHQSTRYVAPSFHETYPGQRPGHIPREIIRVYGKVDRAPK